jgi:hypothetical protein
MQAAPAAAANANCDHPINPDQTIANLTIILALSLVAQDHEVI